LGQNEKKPFLVKLQPKEAARAEIERLIQTYLEDMSTVTSFSTDGRKTVVFLTGGYASEFAVNVDEILEL
jgi:hypothetical protein